MNWKKERLFFSCFFYLCAQCFDRCLFISVSKCAQPHLCSSLPIFVHFSRIGITRGWLSAMLWWDLFLLFLKIEIESFSLLICIHFYSHFLISYYTINSQLIHSLKKLFFCIQKFASSSGLDQCKISDLIRLFCSICFITEIQRSQNYISHYLNRESSKHGEMKEFKIGGECDFKHQKPA